MGVLNLKTETYHRQKITTVLQRRDMTPDLEEEWEIHGPHHPELPYQVYVGYVVARNDPNDCPLVAIYPRAVYEIEDRSDWGKVIAEMKIPTTFFRLPEKTEICPNLTLSRHLTANLTSSTTIEI